MAAFGRLQGQHINVYISWVFMTSTDLRVSLPVLSKVAVYCLRECMAPFWTSSSVGHLKKRFTSANSGLPTVTEA